MTPKVRNSIYICMGILNALLLAATQEGVVPAAYAQYVALASIVVAGAMKSFMPEAPPPPPPAVPS